MLRPSYVVVLGSLLSIACSSDSGGTSGGAGQSAGGSHIGGGGGTEAGSGGTGARANSGGASGAGTSGAAGSGAGTSTGGTAAGGQSGGGAGGGFTPSGTLAWEDDWERFPDGDGDGNPEWHKANIPPEVKDDARWDIISKAEASADGVDVSQVSGDKLYHGRITKASTSGSHRAYPVTHLDDAGFGEQPGFPDGIPSPLVNQWYIWWDPEGQSLSGNKWMHFATYSNNVDWVVNTINVTDDGNGGYMLSLRNGSKVKEETFFGDRHVPTREWFRLTVYLDYSYDGGGGVEDDGLMVVWINDTLVGKGTGGHLDPDGTLDHGFSVGTTRLLRAHWGVYAHADTTSGRWYEDVNRIWVLDSPLTDFSRVPLPPGGS